MFDCLKRLSWMRKLFWEMANKGSWPKEERRLEVIEVYTDSDAAFPIAVNKQASAKMKHILLKFHFVKNCIACVEFFLLSVPSKENIATC